MARSEKDEAARRLLRTPTAGQDVTKSYFPLSEGESPEERIRDLVGRHHSAFVSELVTLSGIAENEVRGILTEMERRDEGYFSRDLPRKEEVFTASPINIGKTIVERRLQDQAGRLGVRAEHVEWTPTKNDGEGAYTLTVTSRGGRREAMFTQTELEEIAEGVENKNIINSRLFNLVSPYKVRRII